MSLQTLPVEIVLQIVSEVESEVDRACVRIACRSIYHTVAPTYVPTTPVRNTAGPHGSSYPFRGLRRAFLERLFKDGNIFHNRDVNLCGFCLLVTDSSMFPLSSMKMNDRDVCEICIAGIVYRSLKLGAKFSYREAEYWICGTCLKRDDNDAQAHAHYDRKPYDNLCEFCHADICGDKECPGWPDGWVERHYELYPGDASGDWGICKCLLCHSREGTH